MIIPYLRDVINDHKAHGKLQGDTKKTVIM